MKVEYWVHGIKSRNGNDCVVIGRIIEGELIVGDVFQYVEECVIEKSKKNTTLLRSNRKTVEIVVTQMDFLCRKWEELYAGSTPGLTLSGSGVENITDTAILGFENSLARPDGRAVQVEETDTK